MLRRSVLGVILAVVLVGAGAHGATYYVNATAGNDANTGLSSTAAWKTIQKAATSMPAGNTCSVAPGTYNERVRISRSGTATAPLIFKGAGAGVVVNGGFNVSVSGGIVRYVQIEGFTVTVPRQASLDNESSGSGIYLRDTQYCEVRNNYIHHTLREGVIVMAGGAEDSTNCSYNLVTGNRIEYAGGYAGITVSGAFQTLENNDISHSIQHPLYPTTSTAGGSDADGIKFSGRDLVIRGNYIHDIIPGETGNVNPHIDAVQTFGPAYNILIEQNEIKLPTSGTQAAMIEHGVQPVRDLTFRYNVVTAYRGWNIWGLNPFNNSVVPIYRVNVNNNTFYGVRDYDVELHDSPNSVVKNNMLSATGRYMSTNSSPATGSNGVPGTLTLRSGDIRISDPMFVDPANRDFRLKSGSPLIDRGANLAYTADFDDTAVPQGSAPDIGAFEFVQGTQTPTDTTPPVITLLGTTPVTVALGSTYTDAGATAMDNTDGDITSRIVKSGSVNTSVLGTYTITHNVSDTAGNAATPKTRTVNVADKTKPVITLIGAASVTVQVGSTYTDDGATATDNVDGDITSRIVKASNVNTQTAGTYTVTYNVSDTAGNAATTVVRTVTVSGGSTADTTPPVITLLGSASVSVNLGSTYTDAGATAQDNVDGDITSRIVKSGTVNTAVAGTYKITYTVSDLAGNAATPVVRTVTVVNTTVTDTTRPVITLLGSASVTIRRNSTYVDAGATARDNVDGDITSRIVKSGTVNTSRTGTYRITYNVSDSAGNAATPVTRTVKVVNGRVKG